MAPPRKRAPGYEVGYQKPPKHTQFKPGQSGNPKGRPKAKSKNQLQRVHDILLGKIAVQQDGNLVKMTRIEAMLNAMIYKSIRGDVSAFRALIDVIGSMQYNSDLNKVVNNKYNTWNGKPVEDWSDEEAVDRIDYLYRELEPLRNAVYEERARRAKQVEASESAPPATQTGPR